MLLKLLKLRNFRQFYGETEIIFSIDPIKNITLIHGENGVGKTTLLNAILWCLFEHLTPDFEQSKDLVSHEAVKENRKSCKVEVCFEHEDNEYQAIRSLDKSGKILFKVFIIDEGNFQEMPGPTGFINSVLPKNMAPYFFFHGEGIASISDTKSSAKFREAVRNILGFTFAESAIEDLKKIKTEYTREIGNLDLKENAFAASAEAKANAEEELNKANKLLQSYIDNTNEITGNIETIEEKLGSSGNLDAERLKRDIHMAEARLKTFRSDLDALNSDRQGLIQKYGWAIFGSDLMEQGLDFIDESTLKGKIPAPYQDQFVNDILEKAQCICGRALEEGSSEELNVKKLLETAGTALLSQRVMKARGVAARLTGTANEFLETVVENDKKKGQLDKAVGDEERNLKDFEIELNGIDEEGIKRLTAERNALRLQKNQLLRNQGSCESEIEQLEKTIRDADRELASKGANSAAYQRLKKIQLGVEQMISRCERKLDEFESSARHVIAQKVNDFLIGFSRKDYSVKVTETFDFHLARTDGNVVAKSKGEKLLLNLAFVSALIEHAEARARASGEFLVQGTVAPFVIDAPFGELDDTYRKATAEFLPSKVKQIVFLLSSSHWSGTVDKAIRDKVGCEYLLISNRKGEQGNKPDDLIIIGGSSYKQSYYESDKDRTLVKKVS